LTYQTLFFKIKKNVMCRACGTGDVHTGFWCGNPGKRNHLEDVGIDGDNIKMHLQDWDGEACTAFLWLRIGTGGELL
jgi:hypothetical protein